MKTADAAILAGCTCGMATAFAKQAGVPQYGSKKQYEFSEEDVERLIAWVGAKRTYGPRKV